MAIVQPFNYIQQEQANPLLQGIQVGATMAQAQAMRQQAEAKAAEVKAEERRRREYLIEQSRFFALPKPTTMDVLRFAATMPPDVQRNIGGMLGEIPKTQKAAYMRDMGQVVSAIEAGEISTATNLLRERGRANPDEFASADRLATMIERNPTDAMKIIAPVIAVDDDGQKMLKSVAEAAEARRTAMDFPRLMAQRAAELAKAGSDAEKAAVDAKYAERIARANIAKLEAEGQPVEFEVLNAQQFNEKFGASVPPNTVYKRNKKTGEISAIGGAGVTVKLPETIGSIPPDYTLVRDAEGRPLRFDVIPGSATARKLEAESRATAAKETSAGLTGMIVTDEINRLRDLIKNENVFNPVTGLSGRAAEKVLGSARIAAQGNIDTIVANIGFDRLAAMRTESPTGGALGNITERELAFLQSVLGKLTLDMDAKPLLENLDRIQKIYEKAAAYPNAAKFGFARITRETPAPGTAPTTTSGAVATPAPGGNVAPAITTQPVPPPQRPALSDIMGTTPPTRPSLNEIFGR
jgi:hypothetical protein